jgi:hypothetical protein
MVPPSTPDAKKKQAVFRGTRWVVEDIPVPPAIHANIANAPVGGM